MTIVVIDDDEITTELKVPVNDYLVETGLEAGKHYTFNLKVGKNVEPANAPAKAAQTAEVSDITLQLVSVTDRGI